MKNKLLKNVSALFIVALTALGCAGKKQENINASEKMMAPSEVTLISRYTGGDYVSASYSFRHMSQNVELTRNNWEVLFEAREDFQDYFQVNTVVDDHSFIYDLGKKSCSDIKSSVPDYRKSRPLVWLAYSDADPSNLTPTKTALVQEGHCYLSYNNDEDGRVVTLFHVKAHTKSQTVTIDEIEVLNILNAN